MRLRRGNTAFFVLFRPGGQALSCWAMRLRSVMAGVLCWAASAAAVEPPESGSAVAPEPAAEPARVRPSWGARILCYAPNRVMDLLDIFRLRLRVGPGLAANVRLTDYGALYAGQYNTVYVGLPGPRYPHRLRLPVGRESLRGIVLLGVDATDETRHGPEYGAAEVDAGFQFLLAGADAGVDVVEFFDFLGGWLGFDPCDDDYPRPARALPETTSAIAVGAGKGSFQVDPKPAEFGSTAERLDYLHLNVQRRVSEPLRATDVYFAVDPDAPIEPPQTQFELGLYTTLRQGEGFDFELAPNMEIYVELPNLKEKLRVFIESTRADELPQSQMSAKEDRGVNVGMREYLEKLHLTFDVGMQAAMPPEAFTRLTWTRNWNLGKLEITPELRAFYETGDGAGALASLFVNDWVGAANSGIVIFDASTRWLAEDDTLEWASSLALARVVALLDESLRGHHARWYDTARAQALKYAVLGSEGNVDTHRLVVGFRGPLYKQWIYWDVAPGLEWTRKEDYDTAFILQVGVDLLFWGQGYE